MAGGRVVHAVGKGKAGMRRETAGAEVDLADWLCFSVRSVLAFVPFSGNLKSLPAFKTWDLPGFCWETGSSGGIGQAGIGWSSVEPGFPHTHTHTHPS